MILKFLLILGVIALVYFMFKAKKNIQNSSKNNDVSEANEMVACSACGTYTQIEESILSNNKYYCCDECLGKA